MQAQASAHLLSLEADVESQGGSDAEGLAVEDRPPSGDEVAHEGADSESGLTDWLEEMLDHDLPDDIGDSPPASCKTTAPVTAGSSAAGAASAA